MNHAFPTVRPRRLRHHPLIRDLVRETSLSVEDLILPLFVRPGHGIKKEIASMPGNYQLSIDRLVEEVGASHRPGRACLHPLRHSHAQGRHRLQRSRSRRHRAAGSARSSQTIRRARPADDRRVFLRIHRSRTLRSAYGAYGPARSRQRRDAAALGRAVCQPCPGRRRSGRPQRHARRHGRRHPHSPRRRRISRTCRS